MRSPCSIIIKVASEQLRMKVLSFIGGPCATSKTFSQPRADVDRDTLVRPCTSIGILFRADLTSPEKNARLRLLPAAR